MIALSLIFYGYCAVTWPAEAAVPRAYNQTIQEQVWTILNLAFSGLFLVLTLVLRPAEWEWLAGLWLFWLLGDVAQFIDPNLQTHFSGWQRLSALVTYPLLSILVHRQLLTGEAPASSEQITDVDYLQEILQGIESTSEPEPALMIASSKFAKLLDVDMCAIALEAESEPPKIQVIAVHPPTTAQMETPELALDAYPVLQQAYEVTSSPRGAEDPSNAGSIGALWAPGLPGHRAALCAADVSQRGMGGHAAAGQPRKPPPLVATGHRDASPGGDVAGDLDCPRAQREQAQVTAQSSSASRNRSSKPAPKSAFWSWRPRSRR